MSRWKWWLLAAVLAGALGASGAARGGGIMDVINDMVKKQAEKQASKTVPPAPPVRTDDALGTDALGVNRSLNSAAGDYAPRDGATKLVPIISVGQGKALGLAQVAGPARAVDGVQAVLAIEVALVGQKLKGKVLVPIDSRDLSKAYRRVGQVGVSAMLDYKL